MTEPRTVELWTCGYIAKCSARGCRRRATTILRYLDSQGRPDHQIDACDIHASELCAELRVIDRPQALAFTDVEFLLARGSMTSLTGAP